MTMQMHKPPHAGEVLRELCTEPLGLSITETAEGPGVSRKTLSAVLNGRAGISPEMALRLFIAFDTTPESWLNQQTQFDLWVAGKEKKNFESRSYVRPNTALPLQAPASNACELSRQAATKNLWCATPGKHPIADVQPELVKTSAPDRGCANAASGSLLVSSCLTSRVLSKPT